MSDIESRLNDMGITVPERTWNAGRFPACKRVGDLLFMGGHGPTDPDGVMRLKGKLGKDLTVEQGYQAARNCATITLANAKSFLEGDLDRIVGVAKVLGFINSAPDFVEQPEVLHGFSEVWLEALGPSGAHARSAVGVSTLPGNISVEVESILIIRD